MKPEVEKLVFTEYESDNNFIPFMAESPFGTYYIDYDKSEKTYSSYCQYAEIGEDNTLIKAIQRVNAFHADNIIKCLAWEQ